MRHWLVIFLWALPTLVVVGLWINSTFAPLKVLPDPNPPPWTFRRVWHHVALDLTDPPVPTERVFLSTVLPSGYLTVDRKSYFFNWIIVGTRYQTRGPQTVVTHHYRVSLVPLFWLTMPTLWRAYRAWRRGTIEDQRRRGGLCSGCGYDIRATPDRCPECGSFTSRSV